MADTKFREKFFLESNPKIISEQCIIHVNVERQYPTQMQTGFRASLNNTWYGNTEKKFRINSLQNREKKSPKLGKKINLRTICSSDQIYITVCAAIRLKQFIFLLWTQKKSITYVPNLSCNGKIVKKPKKICEADKL